MRYEDFVIQIGPDTGQGYSVSVVKSPAGEGAGFFRLPFDEVELGQVFGSLHRQAKAERSDDSARDLTPAPVAEDERRFTPRQVGSALFHSLFSGQIRTLFDQSVGSTGAHSDTGLRIQIKLNPEHPDLARLYSLPWEFLYRPDTQDFLSLSRLSPVVRYLDVSRPTSPFPLPSPLRILVVISSPRGLTALNLKRERTNIESAWGQNKNVKVVFLQEATLGSLREELLEGPFHVLHFMGHGGFDSRSGEGVLYFVAPDGGQQPISGHALASKLKDFKSLRLVFLNACNTAKTSGQAGVNPFAGVASALVLGGMPAVVAMQLPISDQSAIAFSRSFYQRLAAGDPVDTAVAEGRQAVHSEEVASTEWATPVLFLRTPDGALFSRKEGAPVTDRSGALLSTKKDRHSLLGGGAPPMSSSTPRKGSAGKKIATAVLGLIVVAGIAIGVVKISSQNSADLPAESTISEVSAPVGARARDPQTTRTGLGASTSMQPQAPITIKKADPAPTAVLEIDQGFSSDIAGFTGRVSQVELRGNRMRWYFHFLNQTKEDRECGINYGESYVADEFGNRYQVLEAEEVLNVTERYRWDLQIGVRLDRWIEFPSPMNGAKLFTVGLVPYRYSYNVPKFPTFTASLPL